MTITTRVTPKVLALIAVPIMAALFLVSLSVDANSKFSPMDPARLVFAGIPAVGGVGLLLLVGGCLAYCSGRELSVSGDRLLYKDARRELDFEINQLECSRLRSPFRGVFELTDGVTSVQFPAIFLSESHLQILEEMIEQERKSGRQLKGKGSYSL